MLPNPQFYAGLVIFIEETPNKKVEIWNFTKQAKLENLET